jgi:hypothetical protein
MPAQFRARSVGRCVIGLLDFCRAVFIICAVRRGRFLRRLYRAFRRVPGVLGPVGGVRLVSGSGRAGRREVLPRSASPTLLCSGVSLGFGFPGLLDFVASARRGAKRRVCAVCAA